MLDRQEGAVRAQIEQWLAEGLRTQTAPFPEDSAQFAELLADLRVLDPNDLKPKLVKCGLTNHPVGPDRMRCQECMHYLVHRMWCDLPELAIPVEPDWWCRLWRI